MTRVVLLAGASGSGKSRLASLVGAQTVRLDDFYLDADAPGLPRRHGQIDWDDPRSWNADAAVAALGELVDSGHATVPIYSIAKSRRTGTRTLELAPGRPIIAEGVFAVELLAVARAASLAVEPVYLDRNRTLVALLRLRRDLAQHRKAPGVLLRRGLDLWRRQPDLRRRALAAGFRSVTMKGALALLTS